MVVGGLRVLGVVTALCAVLFCVAFCFRGTWGKRHCILSFDVLSYWDIMDWFDNPKRAAAHKYIVYLKPGMINPVMNGIYRQLRRTLSRAGRKDGIMLVCANRQGAVSDCQIITYGTAAEDNRLKALLEGLYREGLVEITY